jgi:hypothetical protein
VITVTNQRNGRPMSNAERQRRFRDKRRGGPPVGRWPADYMSLSAWAEIMGMSRTTLARLHYLDEVAPGWAEALEGDDRPVSITKAYYLMRLQVSVKMLELYQRDGDRSGEGYEIATRFRKSDGTVTAYWRCVMPRSPKQLELAKAWLARRLGAEPADSRAVIAAGRAQLVHPETSLPGARRAGHGVPHADHPAEALLRVGPARSRPEEQPPWGPRTVSCKSPGSARRASSAGGE